MPLSNLYYIDVYGYTSASKHLYQAQNKEGGLTRQPGQPIDVPTLTANIFAVVTNITNIHIKTGSTNL